MDSYHNNLAIHLVFRLGINLSVGNIQLVGFDHPPVRWGRVQTPEVLALKQESRILQQTTNPVCGLSMMEQVGLCAV